ncbi:MAG: hypothetical protein ACI9D0_001060 [Bacteroidia bacterium]|jgi:hypothetical protein
MSLPLIAELVALAGGTVLTMTPVAVNPALPDAPVGYSAYIGTVLIEDGTILEAGPDVVIPEGAEIIDASGLFIIPGLIDGFVQFDGSHDALYTVSGVTTVRDVGGSRTRLLDLRDNRDTVPGPKLLTAGSVLGGNPPASPEAAIFQTAEDVDRLLPIVLGAGVDFLSIYPNMPEAAWRRTIELGKEHGFQTWSPVSSQFGLMSCLSAGQEGFFYLDALLPPKTQWDFVQPLAFKRNIAAFVEHNAAIVPMLHATAQRLESDAPDEEWRENFFQYLDVHYEAFWRDDRAQRNAEAAKNNGYLETGERVLEKQFKVLKMLDDAGARLIPGSGSPHPWLFPGNGLIDELMLWEAAGLDAERILAAATIEAADAFGLAGSHGQIQAGFSANLVCLARDPRLTPGNLYNPEMVVNRGLVMSYQDLAKIKRTLGTNVESIRALAAMPIEIAKPDTPKGEVVLEGFLESSARNARISGERWAIVREPDGGISYCGRIVTEGNGAFLDTDLSIVQRTRDGKLESVFLKLEQGPDILVLKGNWAGERFHLERRLNGIFVDNSQTPERPVTIEVGSITSLLLLGQTDRTGNMPVVFFHEGFDAEVIGWELQIAEQNIHFVRTQRSLMGFAYTPKGGITSWKTETGDLNTNQNIMRIETKILEESAFGGPGMPMLATKKQTMTTAPTAGPEAPAETDDSGTPKEPQETEKPTSPPKDG